MKDLKIDTVVLAGGVSANRKLRELIQIEAKRNGFKSYMPNLEYCTDNAAMIGCAAHYNYINGIQYDIHDKLDLNAYPSLKIGEKR
ncbi:tRNA N6-adenosine threonylcarbamoyltransferase [compost metagenome]